MNELIEKIKTIMTDVATGQAKIQDTNDEYKKLFRELDDIFSSTNQKNPNGFSDLWEFYSYWKKKKMDTYAERRSYVIELYKNIKPKKQIAKSGTYNFVNQNRIKELRVIKSNDFDISKLVRFCEELNSAFSFENFLSTAMLVRAIVDHIPPVFGKTSFTEVANNHGSKSFKDSMKNLDNSSRKISDSHLHTQIRKKEVLPNSNQVDFSNDLDVLLSEVCRVLK